MKQVINDATQWRIHRGGGDRPYEAERQGFFKSVFAAIKNSANNT